MPYAQNNLTMKQSNKVIISAPGKLMLFGEHAVVYGRPCLAAAVDTRLSILIKKIPQKKIKIKALQVGITDFQKSLESIRLQGPTLKPVDKRCCFVEAAMGNFYRKYGLKYGGKYKLDSGFELEIKNGFSSKYGLGSSSAVTVCMIKALSELFKVKLSKKEIFDLAYKSVLDVQGVGSGFDVAAAVWGGVLFYRSGGKEIKLLKIRKLSLVIVYSGTKADTPTLIKKVAGLRFKKFNKIEKIFDQIEKIVLKTEKSLILEDKRDLRELGELMNKNQKLLASLGVSSPKIDLLVKAALSAGAYGAKLSGAGGGDCIIALVSKEKRHLVEQALVKTGGVLVPVETGAEGVRKEL